MNINAKVDTLLRQRDDLASALREALAILNSDEPRSARIARLNPMALAMLDQMERDSQTYYDLEHADDK